MGHDEEPITFTNAPRKGGADLARTGAADRRKSIECEFLGTNERAAPRRCARADGASLGREHRRAFRFTENEKYGVAERQGRSDVRSDFEITATPTGKNLRYPPALHQRTQLENCRKFQTLELLRAIFTGVGTFSRKKYRRWKFCG